MSEWTQQTAWVVELVGGGRATHIDATLLIEGGALVFRDIETGVLETAYGPGMWRTVGAQ